MARSNKRGGNEQEEGFKRRDIEAHHRSLEREFVAVLNEEVEIVEPENWWRRADKEVVAFELIGKKSGRAERARRKDRGWHQVVPTRAKEPWWSDCQAWISWYEEWISIAGSTFELRSAGLTLFWGPPQSKHQIIRAEWAEPPKHGGAAAQPHWHADFEQIVDDAFFEGDEEGSLSEDSERLYPKDLRQLGISLSGCHLAMGGWLRTEIEGNPWQARIGRDLRTLTNWGVATMAYITSQLAQCRRAGA